jgi:hypothetical protein
MSTRLQADRDNWPDIPRDDATVTVCSACLRASCWQGKFMCEASRNAGTREMTVKELAGLGHEHPSHWSVS